jgi:hypothetical protein
MSISSSGRGNMDAQEQPALPTWLESLRANERPRTSASGQSFSTADLVDEDDLPGWMRPEHAEMGEDVNAGQYGTPRPSSMPAPNTDAGMPPPRGFSASSLIDSASLPSWVQGNQQAPGSGSYFPGEAQAPFSAASLIEPDSLPSWITGQQSQQPPAQSWSGSGSATSNASQQAQSGRVDPETPPRLMSAQDLIDPQAMPSWMSGWPGETNQPTQLNQPGQQSRQSQPGQMAQSTWQPPQAAPGNGDSGSGLSAASLLDMNALPSWLREGQQGYTGQPGQPGQGGSNSNLSAGSLIDMNALPAWLRNADSQPQGTPPGSNVSPSSGRVESIRVPSRPRAEMAPQEQSEVAATIFSSMLGVASGAPSYPAQPAPFGVQPQQNFQNVPAQSPTAIPNTNTTGQPMPPGFAGSQPMQQGTMPAGYSGGYSQYPGAYQGGQSGQGGYGGGYPGGTYAPGPVPIQFPGMSAEAYNAAQRAPVNSGNQVNQAGAKPAKRSIIDTIREWFHL